MIIVTVASYFRIRFNLCFRSMMYNEKKEWSHAWVSIREEEKKNICARGHQTHNLLWRILFACEWKKRTRYDTSTIPSHFVVQFLKWIGWNSRTEIQYARNWALAKRRARQSNVHWKVTLIFLATICITHRCIPTRKVKINIARMEIGSPSSVNYTVRMIRFIFRNTRRCISTYVHRCAWEKCQGFQDTNLRTRSLHFSPKATHKNQYPMRHFLFFRHINMKYVSELNSVVDFTIGCDAIRPDHCCCCFSLRIFRAVIQDTQLPLF